MSSTADDRSPAIDTVSSSRGDPATRRRILDAALRLILRRRGADVRLADVARAARVSRQALYLHFGNRSELLLAVVRYSDERRGLPAAIGQIESAPSGVAALQAMLAMQAKLNPTIWPLARIVDAAQRKDPAAERSWRDRLEGRMRGCRAIVARLADEGSLRPGLEPAIAADLLWTLTSLHTWEHLVLLRRWTAKKYEERLTELLMRALVSPHRRRPAGDAERED